MRRFLVTGGAGFIGSHLVDVLLAAGHTVWVLDDLSTGNLRNIAHHRHNDRFKLVEGSILDGALVTELVDHVEGVYHLAAVVGVTHVLSDPLRGMLINVRGTENVLEAACRRGVKIVVASSSEVYGKSTQVPFRELDDVVLGPTSVPRWSYALSKLLDEHLAFAYHRQKGLAAVAIRYFNAYGPRLDPRGYGSVVARFIMQCLRSQPLTVYGDGLQTRSFTFVEDAVRGTLAAMHAKGSVGLAFNIGNPTEVTIYELVHRVRDLTGAQVEIIHTPFEQIYGSGFEETRRRCPDIARAQELLGFEPKTDLEVGLQKTIQWFKEHGDAVISA